MSAVGDVLRAVYAEVDATGGANDTTEQALRIIGRYIEADDAIPVPERKPMCGAQLFWGRCMRAPNHLGRCSGQEVEGP